MTNRKVMLELKSLLVKKNVESKDLADKIGMKRDTMYKKLNGYIPFKKEEVEQIKNELQIADKDVYKYFY